MRSVSTPIADDYNAFPEQVVNAILQLLRHVRVPVGPTVRHNDQATLFLKPFSQHFSRNRNRVGKESEPFKL